MADLLRVVSPVDGRIYVERPLATHWQMDAVLAKAVKAQAAWHRRPLADRIAILSRALQAISAHAKPMAEEITWQMGRPVAQTPGEIAGMQDRGRYMLSVAESALAPIDPGPKEGFARRVERVPLGV